jgi:ubiquinone/menaquinone biosynthesis C-methylase UbiE
VSEEQCACTPEACDIFDFMANHVGMTVIHPGGFAATRMLAESCYLDSHARVVDIACGKGTSAVYLAERYGCEVVGIDISSDLVAQATILAKKRRLAGKVTFGVGDALQLPFPDNEFDAAVSQAMLVLVADKRKAVLEAMRVTKPGGYLGWLELSWKKPPTADFLAAVSNVLCAYCMQNVHTFPEWEELLKETGVNQLAVQVFDLGNAGMMGMLASEGLANTGRVMLKYLTNGRVRKRMRTMGRFFKEHTDYFGYGIYTGRK